MRIPDYPNPDIHQWAAVDDYFGRLLAPQDAAFEQILECNKKAQLPVHDVSAVQGKFLALLVQLTKASRVLEIGTLGGYSTAWMAKALPAEGIITTLEINPDHAKVARENWRNAQLDKQIDLHIGSALDILPTLNGPFDLVFIDADKPNNPRYLEWAIKLSRPGTLIIGDNVVRGGGVINSDSSDLSVKGVREFISMMAADPRLESTALQTVGEKGWDGFSISIVKNQ
ncbi:MAG: O-methyltransferase [Rouxiella aceris]|uniref:O-methyltransferase n=1 Tax=Rouxiella aceris TaxID=2703884 RepID=UPI00283ED101|nr:O-methyltransferase [Rouxiella aceris]MDR3434329.1 O-methyltransferase [Rouxiella aceris]